jgi:hypothetical protein
LLLLNKRSLGLPAPLSPLPQNWMPSLKTMSRLYLGQIQVEEEENLENMNKKQIIELKSFVKIVAAS